MSRQSGQAIIVGLAMLIFGVVAALLVFNTGIATSEKMRLTNTAEAAAYSGVVWQARSLNFQAYTNRAMIANQVAIAQVVSFASWMAYLETATENINYAVGWIPFVGAITGPLAAIVAEVAEVVREVGEVVVQAMDVMLTTIATAQQAVHIQAMAATPQIVEEVVERNDRNFKVTDVSNVFMAKNLVDWQGFTEHYDSSDDKQRFADVVMGSRDKWTRDRNWRMGLPLIPPYHRLELIKEGQTKLLEQTTWQAKDTLSLHFSWICFKRGRPRTCRSEMPLGWGGAYSGDDPDYDQRFGSRNRYAERLADSATYELHGYSGVRPYYDVRNYDDTRDDTNGGRRIGLAVEVYNEGSNIQTSSNPDSLDTRGQFRQPDNFAANRMSALGKAEVYFQRPYPDLYNAGQVEYGNLFNPYWQVRLIEPDRAERLLAWERRGASGLFSALFP